MASTSFIHQEKIAIPQLSSLEASTTSPSEDAVMLMSTTKASADVPTRRVSDLEIDARHRHQLLLAREDISVTSSSSDESSQVVTVLIESQDEKETKTVQSSIADEPENLLPIIPATPSESEYSCKTLELETESSTDSSCSFQSIFQMWHSNRVAKRKYPSVNAFPSLPQFQGFEETNTACGYTFGPYFDRWYLKQQERFSLSHRKRSSSEDLYDVSPRSANKKFKSNDNGLSSALRHSPSSIQQRRNLNSLHRWNANFALYRSEIVELPPSFVPGPYTVIMGRRLKAPGCIHLRRATDQYAVDYKRSDALDKSRIVTRILKMIYEKAPIGAFVRCKARRYYEVEDLIAREKIVSELIAGGLQFLPESGETTEEEDEDVWYGSRVGDDDANHSPRNKHLEN